MDIIIREFNKNDKKQILDMFFEFGHYFMKIDDLKRSVVRERYADYFYNSMKRKTSKNRGKIFVAKESETEKSVGFIAGNTFNVTVKNSVESIPFKGGRVLEFFVREEYRGKGVGTALMERLVEYFKDQKCDTVNVEVFSPNKSAYKFYSSFGFEDRNIDMMKVL